ncbi:MAG: hypothetical protein ACYTAN_18700 [Planctomycetota bacterium]
MPLADWNDPATWERWYVTMPRRISKPATETDITMHYSRAALYDRAAELAVRLESAFGWTPPGGTIAMQGCGYGWTVEALEGRGYTRVVGADISTLIQGSQDDTEEAEIDAAITAAGMDPATGRGALHKATLYTDPGPKGRSSRRVKDEDGLTQGSRNRLRSSVGLGPNDDFDWLLSEYLLETVSDAEAIAALPHYTNTAISVVHIIAGADGTKSEPDGNWKGAAGWRAFLDANGFNAHQLYVGPSGEVI